MLAETQEENLFIVYDPDFLAYGQNTRYFMLKNGQLSCEQGICEEFTLKDEGDHWSLKIILITSDDRDVLFSREYFCN